MGSGRNTVRLYSVLVTCIPLRKRIRAEISGDGWSYFKARVEATKTVNAFQCASKLDDTSHSISVNNLCNRTFCLQSSLQ